MWGVKLGVHVCSFGECEKGNAAVPVVKMIKVPIMNLHTDSRDDKVPIMGLCCTCVLRFWN